MGVGEVEGCRKYPILLNPRVSSTPATINTRCRAQESAQVSRDLCDSGLGVAHGPANHMTMRTTRWPADSEIKRRRKARLISFTRKAQIDAAFTWLLKRPGFPGLDCSVPPKTGSHELSQALPSEYSF